MQREMFDLIIVGAGPIGLELAILAKRAGLKYLVLEKGTIVNAIYHYPTYMTFFTTSERLEIGGHPLITAIDKPTRKEALDYYRKVSSNEGLNLKTFHEVKGLKCKGEHFSLNVHHENETFELEARKVAIATGYFDNPKKLGVPGEDLPHVSHYYSEAHSFYGREVTIIGAGSSAADAALDLYRAGAKVTIVHRGSDFRHSLKYWIRPNLENRVKEGAIKAYFNSVVKEISQRQVTLERYGESISIPTSQVFALTGYFASTNLIEQVGVNISPGDYSAELNPESFESNIRGLYIVGSAGFGIRTSDVFIENGLVHAHKAIKDMVTKLKGEVMLTLG
ncbi:MAG: YpdA family putative bacillithiol disulfide reductase [Deinococcales bacterium]